MITCIDSVCPAHDGPEVEIIKRILKSHTEEELMTERAETEIRRLARWAWRWASGPIRLQNLPPPKSDTEIVRQIIRQFFVPID